MARYESIGILGVGNMGRALLKGLLEGKWSPEQIAVFDVAPDALAKARELAGDSLREAEDVQQLAGSTDVLLVCVKPQVIRSALSGLEEQSVRMISIAAGVSVRTLRDQVQTSSQIVRVMPNTPAQVGMGMSFLAPGENVEPEFLEFAESVLSAVGRTRIVEESKLDAATALSGSGPAYVFYVLEALQEAGIYMGFDAETALEAATQTLRGAAQMAAESEHSPAELRLQVSSPGGTTVEALKHLDETGTKGQIQEAVRRAWEKSKEL